MSPTTTDSVHVCVCAHFCIVGGTLNLDSDRLGLCVFSDVNLLHCGHGLVLESSWLSSKKYWYLATSSVVKWESTNFSSRVPLHSGMGQLMRCFPSLTWEGKKTKNNCSSNEKDCEFWNLNGIACCWKERVKKREEEKLTGIDDPRNFG